MGVAQLHNTDRLWDDNVMNMPVFLGALSGALVFMVAAFLPYWLSKLVGQRITNLFHLVASLLLVAIGCVLLGIMVSMIPSAFGGKPASATGADKLLLQAMSLPWVAAIFGGFVGRKSHLKKASPSEAVKVSEQPKTSPLLVIGGLLVAGVVAALLVSEGEHTPRVQPISQPASLPDTHVARPAPQTTDTPTQLQNQGQTDHPPSKELEQADATKRHYSQIYAAHPDADSIIESANFKNWMTRTGKEWVSVLERGSTEQVIAMFNAYKAHEQKKAEAQARAQAADSARAAQQQDEARRREIHAEMQAAADRALERFPYLDQPEYAHVLKQIIETRNQLIAEGVHPSIAITRAVNDHAYAYDPRGQKLPIVEVGK